MLPKSIVRQDIVPVNDGNDSRYQEYCVVAHKACFDHFNGESVECIETRHKDTLDKMLRLAHDMRNDGFSAMLNRSCGRPVHGWNPEDIWVFGFNGYFWEEVETKLVPRVYERMII